MFRRRAAIKDNIGFVDGYWRGHVFGVLSIQRKLVSARCIFVLDIKT